MNQRQSIVLFVAFVIYLVMGGAVFRVLENNTYERAPMIEILAIRTFKDYLVTSESLGPKNVAKDEFNHFMDFATDVYIENVFENRTLRDWNFFEAFFFSLTVVTTIGYGDISPLTSEGRFFCIFYALFGIPMAGILLAAIGDFFSAKLLASHERSRETSKHPRLALTFNTINYLIPGFILFLFLPAAIFTTLEQWTFLEAFYYAVVTLTTIGFGDYVAGNEHSDYQWLYKLGLMCWIVFGLGYLSMILNFIAKAMKSKHVAKIERTVTKNLKQLAFNNEMVGFMRQMNEFYANKTKMKTLAAIDGNPNITYRRRRRPKLKRTSSCPSLNGDNEDNATAGNQLKRSISVDSLESSDDEDDYFDHAESSANFIFDLAMALACGPPMDTHEKVTELKKSSSLRRSSIAHLVSFLNPSSSSLIKKRNSMVPNMNFLENNMTSVFQDHQMNAIDRNNDKNFVNVKKKMSSSSLFDGFVFPTNGRPSSLIRRNNVKRVNSLAGNILQNGGFKQRSRSMICKKTAPRELSVSKLENDIKFTDNGDELKDSYCFADDSATALQSSVINIDPENPKSKVDFLTSNKTMKNGNMKVKSSVYNRSNESEIMDDVIEEECSLRSLSESGSVDSVSGSVTSAAGSAYYRDSVCVSRETIVIDIGEEDFDEQKESSTNDDDSPCYTHL